MELCLKTDGGRTIPLRSVDSLGGNGIIVIRADGMWRPEDLQRAENGLSEKFRRKVVLLDGKFSDILLLKVGD